MYFKVWIAITEPSFHLFIVIGGNDTLVKSISSNMDVGAVSLLWKQRPGDKVTWLKLHEWGNVDTM